MMNVRTALLRACSQLAQVGIRSARLDAQLLLAHAIGKNQAWILSRPEYILTLPQQRLYTRARAQRTRRVPAAYIIGKKEFFGIEFFVTPAVLIPRPESEALVQAALAFLQTRHGRARMIDVGTGSGALAIAVALHTGTRVSIDAVDTSARARRICAINSKRNRVGTRVCLYESDLLSAARAGYDLILANLPYLSDSEYQNAITNYPEIKYEPRAALRGSDDGLIFIRRLVRQSAAYLQPGGAIMLEISPTQTGQVVAIARAAFPDCRTEFIKDLSGASRVAVISPGCRIKPGPLCDRPTRSSPVRSGS